MTDRCWCGSELLIKSHGDKTGTCLASSFHDPKATGRPKEVRRLYVAGPMTGYEDCNYGLFNAVAGHLRRAGWEVVNPAEYGGKEGHYTDILREDLRHLLDCDGIALVGDWWESHGARNEVNVAGMLMMPVRVWTDWIAEGSPRA